MHVKPLIIFLMLTIVLSGCEQQHNPMSSRPGGIAQVSGTIAGFNAGSATMVMTGEGFNQTAECMSSNNRYYFTDVPMATYEIVPSKFRLNGSYYYSPERLTVRIDEEHENIPPILGILLQEGERAITGMVRDDQGELTKFFQVQLFAGGALIDTMNSTSARGGGSYYFIITDPDITQCTLVIQNGYTFGVSIEDTLWYDDYLFNPDTLAVTLDRTVVFQNITSTYTGNERHRVTGYVAADYEFEPCQMELTDPVTHKRYYSGIYPDGYYRFDGVPAGEYRLSIDQKYAIGDSDRIQVTVDRDLELPLTVLRWVDSNYITVTGTVIDEYGDAITGARVSLLGERGIPADAYTTGPDGMYEFVFEIRDSYSEEDVTFRVEKIGTVFGESEKTVHLDWVEGVKFRDIIGPEFTGIDYTTMSADRFFPLASVGTWIYDRTDINGIVGTHTMSVTGPDGGWYALLPKGPAGYAHYQIRNDAVYVQDFNGQEGLLLQFGVARGFSWNVFPGQGGSVWRGSVVGIDEVTVPAGTFDHCIVYEVGITYDAAAYQIYQLWFARDTGPVKMTRTSVSDGGIIELFTDELRGIAYR